MEEIMTSAWPADRRPPDDNNPGVRLIFTGMCIFTYKNTSSGNEARVAFHRGTANHHLRIQVLEDCRLIYETSGGVPRSAHVMELGISDRDPDAAFFQSDRIPFDRAQLQGDDKDFRWLIDLEGPDFHNAKFRRTERYFSTKLKVKHGTFYTYKHTGHYFECEGGPSPHQHLGYVPKVIAADIRLDGGCVFLKIDGQDVLPHPLCDGSARYEIYFSNECDEDCDTTHGDFGLVFDAVDASANEMFNLVPIGGSDNGPADGLCHEVPYEESRRKLLTDGTPLTDETPCMGAGFGSGGGFP
jgi:hypothetical protein